MPRGAMRRAVLPVILCCFFVSGAAGLAYQVAWSKALGLVFGHTVYAVATVLAVFMAGLAAGSAWLGRWSEQCARPVALYGWLELGIALTGALSLAGLAGVRTAYIALFPVAERSPAALLGLRLIGAIVVLFLPTFLMGGTLPVLVRGVTRSSAELGARLARLYWVNTAGAVAGTLAAGFVLLPALGLRRTTAIAVGGNVIAGVMALVLSRSQPELAVLPTGERPAAKSRAIARPLPWLFAAVGATAMAYEIGWTRLLATVLGSSTYAFSLMLATFLAGLVLGSLLFELWWRRGRDVTLRGFARTQTLTALAALLFLIIYERLPGIVPPILRATHETFAGLVLVQFVASALVMLPTAVVFGFNFPVVTVLIAGRESAQGGHAAAVGRAYAANTLGAILGAVATGFWLLPRIGSFHVVALAAGINLLLGVALELIAAPRPWLALATNAVLLGSVVLVGSSAAFYDRAVATFGTVLYWDLYSRHLTLAEAARTLDIVYAADGSNSTISVARTEDYLALRTNGKVDASNEDVTTQLLVGHLGAIFHPSPQHVLVIGFGSGMTVSAVARYPEVRRIDCAEIEPAVIRAAPYLAPLNRGALADPRLRVVLDDARNYLLTTRQRYDLIISEPSNPWIAGVATLFTTEFYRAARERLAPGGVFVQWVQAYSLYPEDLRMVLDTFVAEFPQVSMWHGDDPDLLLVASSAPGPPAQETTAALERLRGLWSSTALRQDYETLGLRQPEGLLGFYLLDDAGLRRLAAGAPRNTDDRTRLEYRAPRALLARNLEDTNRRMILHYQKGPLPPDFPRALEQTTLAAAAETSLNLHDADSAGRFLASLQFWPPAAPTERLRGRLHLLRNEPRQAKLAFQRALRLDPGSLETARGLAEAQRRLGETHAAEQLLRHILLRDPRFLPALETLVRLERDLQAWRQAAELQSQLVSANPEATAEQYALLGELCLRANDYPRAEHALLAALDRDPYNCRGHRNLADLYIARRQWSLARTQLEFVARYFPDADPDTYSALASVNRSLGDQHAALVIARKGRRIFPGDTNLHKLAPFD